MFAGCLWRSSRPEVKLVSFPAFSAVDQALGSLGLTVHLLPYFNNIYLELQISLHLISLLHSQVKSSDISTIYVCIYSTLYENGFSKVQRHNPRDQRPNRNHQSTSSPFSPSPSFPFFPPLLSSYQTTLPNTPQFNRPKSLNAFGGNLMAETIAAIRVLNEHPETVFTVLTGEGRFFSAGADVRGTYSTQLRA